MFRLSRIAPVALFLFASAWLTAAQTPETKTAAPAKPASSKTTASVDKSAAAVDAEQQLKIRRGQARSLLISLSTDARTFRDQTLRARSLARIADALWQVDADGGDFLVRAAIEIRELHDGAVLGRQVT